MAHDGARLRAIYDRTGGNCHLCGVRLAFSNYGRQGERGAWEVEHSVPRASGGTDHGNNLYAAHIACNREKGTTSSRAARAWHGRTRAPASRDARRKERGENTALGAALGALLAASAGVPAMILFGFLGGTVGHEIKTGD